MAHMIIPQKCPIIPRNHKKRIPAYMIIPRRFPRKFNYFPYNEPLRTSNDVTCFHLMDKKYCCSTTCSHIIKPVTQNIKVEVEEAFSHDCLMSFLTPHHSIPK